MVKTNMKPIILSTFDVRAIQDGRKTQLRRVIKPQPISITVDGEECLSWSHKEPYQPGQTLWVRETWADLRGMGFGSNPETDKPWNFSYKADIEPGSDSDRARIDYGVIWRPSIHMPREAARLFLLVKSVSVEQLQEITEEDAWAEGFEPVLCDCSNRDIHGCTDCMNTGMIEPAMVGFVDTWNEIYAKRGHPWESNPWVWKIEFERTEKL